MTDSENQCDSIVSKVDFRFLKFVQKMKNSLDKSIPLIFAWRERMTVGLLVADCVIRE